MSIYNKTLSSISSRSEKKNRSKFPISTISDFFLRTGRCRVCGRRTPMTTIPRYQLCEWCRLKGIKID